MNEKVASLGFTYLRARIESISVRLYWLSLSIRLIVQVMLAGLFCEIALIISTCVEGFHDFDFCFMDESVHLLPQLGFIDEVVVALRGEVPLFDHLHSFLFGKGVPGWIEAIGTVFDYYGLYFHLSNVITV